MQRQPVLDGATLETLVSAAVAAPSIHNTQPWRFRLDEPSRTVQVHAAPERGLPLADPLGRALHLSVGAAVFNLQVAATHLGWEPDVQLLPRGAQLDLLATVHLADRPQHIQAPPPDLYEAIWHRHSSRLPFADVPVPAAVLEQLTAAATAHGAVLSRPGAAESARLLALTADAELRRTAHQDRRAETRSWLKEPHQGPFGIPYAALGPTDAGARLPMREFTGLDPAHRQPAARFEEHPRLLLLSTGADRPIDWLVAGRALEHVLLLATDLGLRASMMYQALEWTDLRWLLRDPCGDSGREPQMLLRLGYGPQGPATPRRPARESIDSDAGDPVRQR
jgi:nitroreductase